MNEKKRSIENHMQTIGMVTLVALVGWMANTLQTNTVKTEGMRVNILSLGAAIDDLKAALADQYTREDAARDFNIRDGQIRDISERVRTLESGK